MHGQYLPRSIANQRQFSSVARSLRDVRLGQDAPGLLSPPGVSDENDGRAHAVVGAAQGDLSMIWTGRLSTTTTLVRGGVRRDSFSLLGTPARAGRFNDESR